MNAFTRSDKLGWLLARVLAGALITVALTAMLIVLGRPCRFEATYRGLIWGGSFGSGISAALFVHLRRRNWSSTIVRFLIVGGIAFFAMLLLVPNTAGAIQRARRVKAMADMREIGRQLKNGVTPSPRLDPWGAPYRVEQGPSGYAVVSLGQCSEPDDPSWRSLPEGPTTSAESDIVYSNGRFLRYSEGERP